MSTPRVVASVLVHDNPVGAGAVIGYLARQTRQPEAILVIDNGGGRPVEDDFSSALADVPTVVVHVADNVGVGGGHGIGLGMALTEYDADLVWLLEHDTFPDDDCLQMMLAEINPREPAVVAASLVRNNYERRYLSEEAELPRRPGSSRRRARPWAASDAGVEPGVTFNSILIPREIIEAVGMPREDFFVGHEDWEFTERVRRGGFDVRICAGAVAIHPTKGASRFGRERSPARAYFSLRNSYVIDGSLQGRRRRMVLSYALGAAAVELITPGRGWRFTSARVHAVADASRGRLGRRHYRFMDSNRPGYTAGS